MIIKISFVQYEIGQALLLDQFWIFYSVRVQSSREEHVQRQRPQRISECTFWIRRLEAVIESLHIAKQKRWETTPHTYLEKKRDKQGIHAL